MTLNLGILAYGSLIDDPGDELLPLIVSTTRNVWTPFTIEFARSSDGRDGAPTLVPVTDGGASVTAVIFGIDASEQEAVNMLYRREIGKVGSDRVYKVPAPDQRNAVSIDKLVGLSGYDLVLYTRIAANIVPLTGRRLAELAIDSARRRDDGRDGISYLIAAKSNHIATPLSAEYETNILNLTGARDLSAALTIIRSER